MDKTDDPLYRKMISSLAPDEELLWSSKPDVNCYFRYQIKGGTIATIFLQSLMAIYFILVFISRHDLHFRGQIIYGVVIDLSSIWVIACVILSRRETPWIHYGITSRGLICTSPSDNGNRVDRMLWKYIKSVVIRKEGRNLVSIKFVPYFFTVHGMEFNGISNNNEVLGLIWKYRPDLIRKASSQHLLSWNETNADVRENTEQEVDGHGEGVQ